MQDALREVRMALLEADVALPVVQRFHRARAREGARPGSDRAASRRDRRSVGVVHRELVALMGERNDALNLADAAARRRAARGAAGLGQDDHRGKLARWLKLEQKKKVLLASCDVYRPAAIEQLATLARQVGGGFLPVGDRREAGRYRARARSITRARTTHDVLIVDTAGRLGDRRGDDARDRASCTRR